MARSLSRFFYRGLLSLHPPSFQAQFAHEMLWIFDEERKRRGATKLLGDALLSLGRQWIVRRALQKWFIGDFTLSPGLSQIHELFAWERIALPESHLPLPRMVQGSLICLLFVMVPLSVLYDGSVRAIQRGSVTRRTFGHSRPFASSGFQRRAALSGLSAEGSLGTGSAFGDSQQAIQSTNEGLDGLAIGSSHVTSPDRNAFEGVLTAFRRYNIVALDDPHGDQVASEFRIQLFRQPGFADKVNDIAFECGNSRYQKVLDRYIAGGKVPHEEIAAVWRNTTQVGQCDLTEQFYSEVRKVNETLPRAKRIRVLALDPPIDWNKVHSAADWVRFMDRDAVAASLIEREAFQRNRKVLVIMGGMHLYRNKHDSYPWVTTLIEKKHPGSVFVIATIRAGPLGATESAFAELQKRLGTSEVPFFALFNGTPAGSLDANPFFQFPVFRKVEGKLTNVTGHLFPGLTLQDLADACLILGPEKIAQVDPKIYEGTPYGKELERRRRILSEGQAGLAPAPPPPNPTQP